MKHLLLAAILCALPLTVTAQSETQTLVTAEDFHNFSITSQQRETAAKAQLGKLSKPEVIAAIKDNLSDKTKIIYQEGYGVYIEYSAADGRDRMWFPGNRGIVTGIWDVQDKFWGPQACFHYYKSINAVTGEYENTECTSAAQIVGNSDVIDERSGDVFNLLSNSIPYTKKPLDIPAWP